MHATRQHPITVAVLVALAALSAAVQAQSLPPPPTGVRAPVQTDKPLSPAGTRGLTPTQTEDDVYVGIKRSAGDNPAPVTRPATDIAKPLTPQGPLAAPAVTPRPSAGTSPNTGRADREQMKERPQVGTGAPLPRPGAGTSPNTGTVAKGALTGKKARTGGDDDLDELEVERRKVQGVNAPIIGGAPPPRPSADTSLKTRDPIK